MCNFKPKINHRVMRINNKELFQLRKDYGKVPKTLNGRIPVITETFYIHDNEQKSYIGVQFWTAENIENKIQTNADESVSHYIDRL